MNRLSLLIFLLLAGSILAPSVRAETTYYGLNFKSGSYVEVPDSASLNPSQVTVIAFVKLIGGGNASAVNPIVAKVGQYGIVQNPALYSVESYVKANGTVYYSGRFYLTNLQDPDATHMLAMRYDGAQLDLIVDAVVRKSVSVNGSIDVTTNSIKIASSLPSTVYIVLIYNRALSDAEIQQIYENPLDPPQDGLVLWYAPDSVDTANGLWKDKSGNGNDGTIYGATPVRVSIPKLSVYDIENNSEIPIQNVRVSLISNNTTISLIPSLLTLPWNSTVTLNVSATGFKPRTLTIPSTISSLAVYLYPVPLANITPTYPFWTNNFTMPDINITGWSGWQVGKEALSLNFDKAIQLFFTQNPNSKAQFFLPLTIWLGMTVLGLVFSQSPLVALTLGVITQASLAGLGAKLDMRLIPGIVTLYLFLFIWILKDFIESFKKD